MGEEKKKSFFDRKIPLNYLYFGFYLVFLLLLNIHHILLISTEVFVPKVFFILYATGQTILELAVILILAGVIRRYLPKWVYYFYIMLTFLFLIMNIVDFMLIRTMDLTFWFSIGMAFYETVENIVELMYLSGITMKVWLVILPLLLMVPFLGLGIYMLSERFTKKRPLRCPQKVLLAIVAAVPICLLTLDLTSKYYVSEESFSRLHKTLPWKTTITGWQKAEIQLEDPLDAPRWEKEQKERLAAIQTPEVVKRPNIFLFISESLRSDYLTAATAPNLTALAQENFSHPNSFSNANASHLSWYAITHANYALYWSAIQKSGWSSGSLPLQVLKQLGYKIHIYSAAQLKYYSLDRLMFGKNMEIPDSMAIFPHYPPKEAWESDKEATDQLIADLDKPGMEEGHLFLIFYDSTHFNYSWPETFPAPYKPHSMRFNTMRITSSEGGIDELKNRYRNSILYVDSLFTRVQEKLKQMERYDEALIVFAADHGEEFLEEGQLFHSSHLSRMQTMVPIYYKLGPHPIQTTHRTTSQVDIFPTLLHYVAGDNRYGELFDGESLMAQERRPFEVVARFNAGRTPVELFIHNGLEKLTVRFPDNNIFKSTSLFVLSLKDSFDERMNYQTTEDEKDAAKTLFSPAFNSFLK